MDKNELLLYTGSMLNPNDALLKQEKGWLLFAEPFSVLDIRALDEVVPALRRIEKAVEEEGRYAAGFMSYEAAPAFDSALKTRPAGDFPLLWFGLYGPPRAVNLPEPSPAAQASPDKTPLWIPTLDHSAYNSAIDRIKACLDEGRTYQVNLTMRLRREEYTENPWEAFLRLARDQNEYAAYIDTGRYAVCSASPELFFRLDGEEISCKPMKGTVCRGRTTEEDRENALWLRSSEKNRAENLMIVDMVRNDLGRIAEFGSVRVTELFAAEKYPTLWQMTSTVSAKTKAPFSEILRALFPSASITGAPKVSTMGIIRDLETTPRKIYTGCIGFFGPNRKARFNVAIRTLLVDRDSRTAEYGTGGGIVADSLHEAEYRETLLKARILTEERHEFSLLETILWTPEEGFFLRERHIARLVDSAGYFGFPVDENALRETLDRLTSDFSAPRRVRLLLDRKGGISLEHAGITAQEKTLRIRLARSPIDSKDPFLFHKTTFRPQYEKAIGDNPECDEVLLWNEGGELTEFTIGNLVVEIGGALLTPPRSAGLLPGTFRAELLGTGKIRERTIRIEDLSECAKIYLVNSVRKMVEAKLIP